MTDQRVILIDEHDDEAKEAVDELDSLDSQQLKEYREELEALGSFPVRSRFVCKLLLAIR